MHMMAVFLFHRISTKRHRMSWGGVEFVHGCGGVEFVHGCGGVEFVHGCGGVECVHGCGGVECVHGWSLHLANDGLLW